METIAIVTNVENRIDGRNVLLRSFQSLSIFSKSISLSVADRMLSDQKASYDTGGGGAPVSLPSNFESKVIAPRNPTLNRGLKVEPKVTC